MFDHFVEVVLKGLMLTLRVILLGQLVPDQSGGGVIILGCFPVKFHIETSHLFCKA